MDMKQVQNLTGRKASKTYRQVILGSPGESDKYGELDQSKLMNWTDLVNWTNQNSGELVKS